MFAQSWPTQTYQLHYLVQERHFLMPARATENVGMGVCRKFSTRDNLDMLRIIFRLLMIQCKRTFAKRFTISRAQRKCPMLGQQQARRQDFAAGEGPKARRGQKPEGEATFLKYSIDVCSNRWAKCEMGAPISNGGTGHHWPPRWWRPWTVVTKMRFVVSNIARYVQVTYTIGYLQIFQTGHLFLRKDAWSLKKLQTIASFYLTKLVTVTSKQQQQTSGISSKAIKHPFNKTVFVFAVFFSRWSYINQRSIQPLTSKTFFKLVEALRD